MWKELGRLKRKEMSSGQILVRSLLEKQRLAV